MKLGIDKRSAPPILQGVHIKDGRLTTTDLETTVSTCIDAAGSLDIVAPLALLEKIPGKLSGAVVLRRDGLDLQVTEQAGSRAYTVASWAPEDYPLETIDPRSFPCAPRAPGWRDAWSQVRHAIGKDPTRSGLTRVSVDGRTVMTTDSYRMVVHTLPAEHVEVPKVRIRGRACQIVEKLKGAASFGVSDVERPLSSVSGADGVTTVSTLPKDETYPNWRVLLPAPGAETMSASVDRKILLGAIDAVSVVASKKDTRVDLAFSSAGDGLHHERALKVSMAAAGIGGGAEPIGFAGDVHHCRCEDPDCTEDHGATWRTAFSPPTRPRVSRSSARAG